MVTNSCCKTRPMTRSQGLSWAARDFELQLLAAFLRFGYVVNIQELNVREQTKLQANDDWQTGVSDRLPAGGGGVVALTS